LNNYGEKKKIMKGKRNHISACWLKMIFVEGKPPKRTRVRKVSSASEKRELLKKKEFVTRFVS